MKTARAIRCASCKKRIRDHHPDLEVLEAGTGRVLYYHADRCAAVAYERARDRGGVWLATHRDVLVSPN